MSRISQDYQNIPGFLIGNARTGWRWVATHYGWEKIKALVKGNAGSKCERCHKYEPWGDVHHKFGRGGHGGKRDDRPTLPDGQKNLEYLCRECHDLAKIERLPYTSKAFAAPTELPDAHTIEEDVTPGIIVT